MKTIKNKYLLLLLLVGFIFNTNLATAGVLPVNPPKKETAKKQQTKKRLFKFKKRGLKRPVAKAEGTVLGKISFIAALAGVTCFIGAIVLAFVLGGGGPLFWPGLVFTLGGLIISIIDGREGLSKAAFIISLIMTIIYALVSALAIWGTFAI